MSDLLSLFSLFVNSDLFGFIFPLIFLSAFIDFFLYFTRRT